MENATQIIFQITILIFSVVIHEVSHGYAALALGDKTAQYSGRLTLNPVKHLDFFGSFLLPLLTYFLGGFIIGWAKPVPYNPYNLTDQKRGSLKVALAGPATNLLIALILGIAIRFYPMIAPTMYGSATPFFLFLTVIIYINIFLGLFNLIPLPPLDGSKIFMDLFPRQQHTIAQLGLFGIFFALIIAYFILPPITNIIFWLFTGFGAGF
jgi:Zn-dependent protease